MSRRLIVVLVSIALGVAACGSGEAAETTTTAVRVKPEATVTYNGEDCVYEGPETMTSGLVNFTYVNETEREVILGWWLLEDDVEYDDFAGSNTPSGGAPSQMVAKQIAWINIRDAETTRSIGVTAGTHALACMRWAGNEAVETMDFMSLKVTD